MDIYKLLGNERKSLGTIPVLSKLIVIAFNNKVNPDELPDKFLLRDVSISKDDLEALLKRISFNANVRLVIKRNGREDEFLREVKPLYTYEITKI